MARKKKEGKKTASQDTPVKEIVTPKVVTEAKEEKTPKKAVKSPNKEVKAKWMAIKNFKSGGVNFMIGDPVQEPTNEVKKLNFVEKA